MSEPHQGLTRERVEEFCRNLSAAQFHTTATFLLAHDAQQRERLEDCKESERVADLRFYEIKDLKAELEAWKLTADSSLGQAKAWCETVATLQAESEGLRHENAAWKLHHETIDQALGLTGMESRSQASYILDLKAQINKLKDERWKL